MKKTKLYTSLLTISTLGACVIPLTSCQSGGDEKKEEKPLTEDQWHTAIDKLWDVSKERNFTMESEIKFAPWDDISETYGSIKLNTKTAGFNNDYSIQGGINIGEWHIDVPATEFMIYHQNNVDWKMEQGYDESWTATPLKGYLLFGSDKWYDYIGNESNPVQLWKLLGILYGWYDAYNYDSTSKEFKFSLIDSSSLKLSLTLMFDDNKNINHINGEFYIKTVNEIALHISLASTFSNYGSTAMPDTFKTDLFDAAIDKYWDRVIIETEMKGDEEQVVSADFEWSEAGNRIFVFKPAKTQTGVKEYEYFYSTHIADNTHKYFLIDEDGNVKKLTEYKDFTDLWGQDYKGAKFATKIKSNQTLVAYLSYNTSVEEKSYHVELTNTKRS